MNTFFIIISILILLSILAVAFFLFAIWRAILGKSSVDLKLATTIDIESKKIEALHKSMGSFSNTQDHLRDEVRDLTRVAKELLNESKKRHTGTN